MGFTGSNRSLKYQQSAKGIDYVLECSLEKVKKN